jgi:hypothetical protein
MATRLGSSGDMVRHLPVDTNVVYGSGSDSQQPQPPPYTGPMSSEETEEDEDIAQNEAGFQIDKSNIGFPVRAQDFSAVLT